MAKLGSAQRPIVCRVNTMERAAEIARICDEHGWHYVMGIEPGKHEDISDLERLLHPPTITRSVPKVGRNELCPCGSGRKYKRCCGARSQ